jgi:RimJ/RimL family protein N-acetyltransferase
MTRGPVMCGEMVRLRPIEAKDAERLWEVVQDPESTRMAGMTARLERSQIDEWAATVSDRPGCYDWAVLAVATREGQDASDDLIGEVVLNQIDPAARSATIRLSLLASYRGRGYGRDAIAHVLAFAFDAAEGPRLHRISLDVLSVNPRTRMLYESLGFVAEGRLREVYPDGESWVDATAMSLLEEEYRAAM